PQSVIHSIVEFLDGTMLAQMSITDMRTCLLYAFGYPERWDSRLPDLNLSTLQALSFQDPDTDRFPCLRLAYRALEEGRTFPAALNAANEIAVQSFLEGVIPFTEIPRVIEAVLDRHSPLEVESLELITEVDRDARRSALEIVESR
ncbi:MAG: 1-deoxy-D-xylulose-5-phosphate reductoisomerase, partial [Acidobacteriota bacterium]